MPTIVASHRTFKIFILLAICTFSCTACKDKIIQLSLTKKNPVEYTFGIPRDSLHKIVIKQFRPDGGMLWEATHKYMVIDEVQKLFSLPGNSFDFFIEQTDFTRKSRIFCKEDGDSLGYLASFYIHLDSINEDNTKVSIITIDPKIIIGSELLPKPPHFVRKDKTIPVMPSTIEEYQILLSIGRLIGEHNMPPLNLPDSLFTAPAVSVYHPSF